LPLEEHLPDETCQVVRLKGYLWGDRKGVAGYGGWSKIPDSQTAGKQLTWKEVMGPQEVIRPQGGDRVLVQSTYTIQ
jgi:hypothetical protein